MSRVVKLGLGLLVLGVLAGCQSFEGAFSVNNNLDQARNAGPPAGAFEATLQQEYIDYAQVELDEFDFEHSNLFAKKALAAGQGETVAPEDLANWSFHPDTEAELSAARADLVEVLNAGGRQDAAGPSATAQVMFDCWVQESEIVNEGHQADDIGACREAFGVALAEAIAILEAKNQPTVTTETEIVAVVEPPARDYLVFFDFDKANIRPDAAAVLDEVAEAITALSSTSISLTGFTDTAGPASYNLTLSKERAAAVKDYLEGLGVSAEITTAGRGQEDPRVPTPDGVREQENRRVEIQIN